MTLQELINAVILKATGKPTILPPNNTKWEKVRGIANMYLKAWANEPGVKWNSLYERARDVGAVSATDEYELDEDITEVSTARGDYVYILTPENVEIPYNLVSYNDLRNYRDGKFCAKIGQSLVFNRKFQEGDAEYRGKIYAPIYRAVEELEGEMDEVPVDDPMWLVIISAAEYIRNDIVKQNQYGNLIAEANNLMSGMIRRNRGAEVRKVRGEWRNPGGF